MEELKREARRRLLERRSALIRLGPGRETGEERAGLAEARFQVELSLRLSERDRHELEEIDAAVGRIDRDAYGKCESCGRAIGRQRLLAVPEARLCLTCLLGAQAPG